jgi:hypothetical protein
MQFIIFPFSDDQGHVLDCAENSYLIKTLENEGFVPMIDSVNGNNLQYLKTRYTTPHRFYIFGQDQSLLSKIGEELNEKPHLVIYFTQGDVVTDFDWDQIDLYIHNLVFGHPITDRTKRAIKKLVDEIARPKLVQQSAMPELPQYYECNSLTIEDRDIIIFEIKKANTLIPYTTVIRQFSIKGYKPLFTNYFACNAFKNDNIAIQFLMKLWEKLMTGPMDLDEMLKRATEDCYPGENYIPIAEPEVYNKSLQQVLEMLNVKEVGHQ